MSTLPLTGDYLSCWSYEKMMSHTKIPILCQRIDDTLDDLSRAKWLSALDLKSGYWQVQLDGNSEKTAFLLGMNYGSSWPCHSGFAMPLPHLSGIWSRCRLDCPPLSPSFTLMTSWSQGVLFPKGLPGVREAEESQAEVILYRLIATS